MNQSIQLKRASLLLRAVLLLWLVTTGCCLLLSAQNTNISGTVTSATTSQPIEGASVTVKGSTSGVLTDSHGNFTISAAPGSQLEISYVGYETQTATVTNNKSLNVVLKTTAAQDMSEVVVVGYGTQRKKDITGSVATVDLKATKDVAAANLQRLLVGQVPGVAVKQLTGRPGQQLEVVVRGLSSLGAGSQPLYVIDGFPIGNSMDYGISPNDIGSITILKDAVSSAIYGARGSNGVVLITTKAAKAGGKSIDFSATYGVQTVPESRRTKVLNGQEFAQFKKDIFVDSKRYFENREPSIDEIPEDFRYPEQTKISTNWFNEILHNNAPFKNVNLTYSDGQGDTKSLFSVSYFKQDGVIKNTDFEQFSAHSNIEGKLNDFIRTGLNITGFYTTNNLGPSTEGRDNLIGSTLLMDPREPVYNEDGTFNTYIGGHDGIFGFPNPVQVLKEQLNVVRVGQILTSGFAEAKFLRHFTFKTSLNALLRYSAQKLYTPSTLAGENAPPPRLASESDNAYSTVNYSADQLLSYDNSFGASRLNVLAGYTAQNETVRGLAGTGSDYPNDLTPFLDAAAIKSASSTEYGWGLNAFFGRVNYVFDEKYLLSATFRREGSSRFGEHNRYGNFPAISAGWRLLNEKFMPKISWLSDLKLRASWGITGNNNIGNYSSLSMMTKSDYILGSGDGSLVRGFIVDGLANPNLGWETSKQLDIGLDLAAFNNKLTFTAEYYKKVTSDMLLPVQIPAISGFTSYLDNIGKVQNTGVEFITSYNTTIGQVGLHTNLNVSMNQNKVLEIRGQNDQILNGTFYGAYSISRIGRPIGMFYGYKVLGIFNNDQEIKNSPTQDGAVPGVYKYYDANGDGVISYGTDDMVEIGNPWPKMTFGVTLGGDYRNFDLNILLNGATGFDVYREIEKSTMNMDGVFNVSEEANYRWRSEQNPGNGKYAGTLNYKWQRESNSRYVYKGDYIWLKNISLGYTFKKSDFFFKTFRLYGSIDNFLLFTKYPGSNPEASVTGGGIYPGVDDETYPISRTFTLGLKLNF
ncbi:SusC/RagA family TonB-linked outer membrane protein [Niabella ginsenosidivorans]|uniref:SusC/RagA family TonB-linked outer membrane protein n=1 Tax=Niabella ginsenosidivorans TaxID=1176587 RepID=A0A1A9I0B0_9BACT|nr:TonB-dependent receptor [Niabella ginsenosidivorans]ANH80775.1 SusC/RagA family TonB-linked outer membrane protein [Niabella ginsenosidivorans]